MTEHTHTYIYIRHKWPQYKNIQYTPLCHFMSWIRRWTTIELICFSRCPNHQVSPDSPSHWDWAASADYGSEFWDFRITCHNQIQWLWDSPNDYGIFLAFLDDFGWFWDSPNPNGIQIPSFQWRKRDARVATRWTSGQLAMVGWPEPPAPRGMIGMGPSLGFVSTKHIKHIKHGNGEIPLIMTING